MQEVICPLYYYTKNSRWAKILHECYNEEVKNVLRFWLGLGVDGFREDVITFISKKEGLPDDYIMPACMSIWRNLTGSYSASTTA